MTHLTSIVKLRVPLGGQEIELQHLDYASSPAVDTTPDPSPAAAFEGGGEPINLLRTRIREKSRFTVFDIDAGTAQAWGEALLRWAHSQRSR